MESKELRIGNILREKHTGDKLVVLELTNDRITFDYKTFTTWQAEPIPLTEEILLKCGFVKSENSLFFHKETSPVQFVISLNTYTIYFKYEGLYQPMLEIPSKLKYLHQLQNLYFALTGQELEIKL